MKNQNLPKIISFVGYSGSGKTTLLEKLIPELKKRGCKIGVVKHSHHQYIEFDKNGKDSVRLKNAGADSVAAAAENMFCLVKNIENYGIDDIAEYFNDTDIILTEGFKQKNNNHKIEVFRNPDSTPLCLNDKTIVGIVTNTDIGLKDISVFDFNQIKELAFFIEKLNKI